MKNVKIVLKPKQGPILGPPKTNKRLGDISSRYGILTKDHLTSSAHKIMNISFISSHWQFCKMYTLDMLVITCMPSHMTGHAPVNRFNPGYR